VWGGAGRGDGQRWRHRRVGRSREGRQAEVEASACGEEHGAAAL